MTNPTKSDVQKILLNASNIEELKVGGQKAVFSAVTPSTGKIVVKITLPGVADERIQREIDIVVSNNFINVPKIYKQGQIDIQGHNSLYILEEFVDGDNLRLFFDNNKPLATSEVIQLIRNLLETVEQTEIQNVVHRDIKPENIIRDTAGRYWLLDFGIARDLTKSSLTQTAAQFGPHTVGYAPPEQFRNLKTKIDSRTDLFSIGVVAYESLKGEHPFINGAMGLLDVLRRTETMAMPSLQIDGDTNGELSSFINVLTEKYPSRRPPNARLAKTWFDEIVKRYF